MAKEQKGFCLYFDWLDRLKDAEVPPEDIARVIYALADYCRYGFDPTVAFTGTLKFAVSLMFDQIKRSEAKVEAQRSNINKRWSNGNTKVIPTDTKVIPTDTKVIPTDTYNNNNNNINNNINNNNNVNVKEKEANASKEKADKSPPNVSEEKEEKKSQTDIYIDRFERFWREYPKKVGKGDARKIWTRLRPSEELTLRMIKAVEVAKKSVQWTKDGGQYIPNPSTWLNQARWEDELTPMKEEPSSAQEPKSETDRWFEEVYMEGRPFG